jgi:hypothetical protein
VSNLCPAWIVAEVAMTGGSVSSLMVSLADLQLFDALILYVTGDNRISVPWAG